MSTVFVIKISVSTDGRVEQMLFLLVSRPRLPLHE
jgi:hypothetical protein